jgi:hypothetical protein
MLKEHNLTERQLAAVQRAVDRIVKEFGGYGEVILVVQRGKIRFVRHLVGEVVAENEGGDIERDI